jgi:hypothetical protein
LGIKYDLNKTEFWADNLKEEIITIEKLLGNWTLRNLSIQGKVTVLKSLALPILVQSSQILHLKLFQKFSKWSVPKAGFESIQKSPLKFSTLSRNKDFQPA